MFGVDAFTYLLDLCVYPTFQRHGNGALKFPNGSVYVGDFRQNTITGHGVMTYWNGDCYEGEWKHGLVRWEWDSNGMPEALVGEYCTCIQNSL